MLQLNFTRALRFASERWPCPNRRDKTEGLVVLAAAAYRFRNAAAFRKITKRMMFEHNGLFTAIPGREMLNETDWRTLGECQKKYLESIAARIADPRLRRAA